MDRILQRLGSPASLDTLETIFNRWAELVGPDVAEHIRPLRINGSVLVLGADHPAWVTRGRMESQQILDGLRARGDTTIARIDVILQRG
jgi:predicted nucleic acid-binding Zn ribbon protein